MFKPRNIMNGIVSPECASLMCSACAYQDCTCECHWEDLNELAADDLHDYLVEEEDDPSGY